MVRVFWVGFCLVSLFGAGCSQPVNEMTVPSEEAAKISKTPAPEKSAKGKQAFSKAE